MGRYAKCDVLQFRRAHFIRHEIGDEVAGWWPAARRVQGSEKDEVMFFEFRRAVDDNDWALALAD